MDFNFRTMKVLLPPTQWGQISRIRGDFPEISNRGIMFEALDSVAIALAVDNQIRREQEASYGK